MSDPNFRGSEKPADWRASRATIASKFPTDCAARTGIPATVEGQDRSQDSAKVSDSLDAPGVVRI